jgi:hypothetical protein
VVRSEEDAVQVRVSNMSAHVSARNLDPSWGAEVGAMTWHDAVLTPDDVLEAWERWIGGTALHGAQVGLQGVVKKLAKVVDSIAAEEGLVDDGFTYNAGNLQYDADFIAAVAALVSTWPSDVAAAQRPAGVRALVHAEGVAPGLGSEHPFALEVGGGARVVLVVPERVALAMLSNPEFSGTWVEAEVGDALDVSEAVLEAFLGLWEPGDLGPMGNGAHALEVARAL